MSAYTQPGAAQSPVKPQTHPDQAHGPTVQELQAGPTVSPVSCVHSLLLEQETSPYPGSTAHHFINFFIVFWSQASITHRDQRSKPALPVSVRAVPALQEFGFRSGLQEEKVQTSLRNSQSFKKKKNVATMPSFLILPPEVTYKMASLKQETVRLESERYRLHSFTSLALFQFQLKIRT